MPEPNLKSMASLRASSMMSSMLSWTLWMKQAEAWGILVGVLRLDGLVLLGVPVPVAHRALDAVLVEQPDVEPDRRVERGVLVQAEPGQVAVEVLGVGRRGEIAVLQAPVGDRAADAVDKLPHALLPFRGAVLAVEILVDHDVGGQLAPEDGDFAVLLLEEDLAAFALDGGRPRFPLDRVEGLRHVHRTEVGSIVNPRAGLRDDLAAGRSAVTTSGRLDGFTFHGIHDRTSSFVN